MEKRVIAVLAGLLCGVSGHAATAPCSPSSVQPLSIRELSKNGAIIKSGTREGMGFVVGWQQGEAWIAAPAHVVFGKDADPVDPDDMESYRAGLEVRLFGDTAARRLCDKGLSFPQVPADLAFICVEWAGQPFFNEGVLARRVKEGDELTLVDFANGEQSRGSVTKTPKAGEKAGATGDVEAKEIDGISGQSGALTATAGGVVGLYLGKDTRYHILSMSAIRAKAALALVPWQLGHAEYYDCTAVRNVCLAVESEVAPKGVNLRNLFSPGSYPLSPGSCAALPEGRYEIVVPPPGPVCEPKVIAVHSAAEDLRLSLQCSLSLTGTWRTEDGDELLCFDTQVGRARCSGLYRQGFGLFEGTANARGLSFTLSGSFMDPAGNSQEASGSLRWSGELLTGEIRRQLEPPKQLKLKRVEDP